MHNPTEQRWLESTYSAVGERWSWSLLIWAKSAPSRSSGYMELREKMFILIFQLILFNCFLITYCLFLDSLKSACVVVFLLLLLLFSLTAIIILLFSYLSVYLYIYLSIYLSICMYIYICMLNKWCKISRNLHSKSCQLKIRKIIAQLTVQSI